jgi:hypothetical protein
MRAEMAVSSALRDNDAALGQHDDDLRRIAACELKGAVDVLLPLDRSGQVRAKEGDQLFVPFGHVVSVHAVPQMLHRAGK